MKKTLIPALLLFLSFAFLPVGDDAQAQPKTLKVGCVEPSLGIVEAITPYVNAKGYEVEPILFDNNVNIIRAVNDNALDAALGVHKPFMEKFNAENKGDLVMVEPYAYYIGMGLFSQKYKNVSDFPEGARIAIMNDAMNMDRALRILGDAGLLKLKRLDGVLTILDISDNPKKLDLIEMDQIQTVRALSELDGAVVFYTHMVNAGLDCRTALFSDLNSKKYPTAIVVKSGSENTDWAKALEDGVRSEPVKKMILEKYVGAYEFFD